ncbi:MAG: phosphatase PAP2 family protein [Anaerolineales bacterium]|nr:phosphatase PAP2 family protein [Anaerolineales bacterium]
MIEWLKEGIPFMVWLQSLGDPLTLPMKFFSFLGTEYFYMLLLPLLLWCIDIGLGLRIGILMLTSNGINALFKLSFGLPRPYWVSNEVQAFSTETSYGLPSGHAQNAVVLWGALAAAIKRWWATIACILIILLTSLSRPYLGVHFPQSVMIGWIIGIIVLVIYLGTNQRVTQWLRDRSLRDLLLLTIGYSLLFLLLGILVLALTSDRVIPTEWIETAKAAAPEADPIDPRNLEGVINLSGMILGFGSGAALLTNWGGFKVDGPILQRFGRYIVGILGLFIIFFGLRLILPEGDSILAQSLRYLHYALVSFWASYLAPRLFVALRLA